MLDMMIIGFGSILTFKSIALITLGVGIGIIFGSIPGLSATMAVVLCLPMTYGLDALLGTSLLCGLFIGGISGGLIAAVLLKIPGTPSSIATVFDGYPMAAKGEAFKALGTGILFSFLGTVFGLLVLIFCAPMLAEVALGFGPFEYFAISFFSLSLISGLSSDSMLKGLLSGLIGVTIGMIGLAPIEGLPRFTLGYVELAGGFDILPFLVGLFAVAEMLHNCLHGFRPVKVQASNFSMRGFGLSMREFAGQLRNFFVSAGIGTGIGILPGVGGGTSNILAYMVAKKTSKHPEKFGTGIIDGVVASESANNGTIGGAMIPLLALGIPGDAVTAILLGGLMMHGLQPGPLLFVTNGDFVYGVFAALLFAAVAMLVLEFFFIRAFVRLLSIPKSMLMPLVITLCILGAFGVNNRTFDVWSVLLFGGLGFVLSVFRFPLAPVVLGFILGHIVEMNFCRALMHSDGSFLPFVTRPVSGFFLLLSVVMIFFPIIKGWMQNRVG